MNSVNIGSLELFFILMLLTIMGTSFISFFIDLFICPTLKSLRIKKQLAKQLKTAKKQERHQEKAKKSHNH